MQNKFKEGDKVKVINNHSYYINFEGKVMAVGYKPITGYNYIVNVGDYIQPLFYEKELVKIS